MKLPQRPPTHVLATEAEKAFQSIVPNEWVIEKKISDYGIDFERAKQEVLNRLAGGARHA